MPMPDLSHPSPAELEALEQRLQCAAAPFLGEEDDDEDDDEGDDEKDEGKDKKESKPDAGMTGKMLKTRTIIASKGVDDKLAAGIISQLLILEQEDAAKPITVIVNSPGGSADSGFAIYDALRFTRCPVRTVVMGICASAGVMIALGGTKGMRFATPSSRYLLHQPSMRTQGQASDLEIVAAEIDRLKLLYNTIISDATGRPVKDIEHDVNRDFWLPATAAKEYGLCNKIITSRREIE
jgi:ATP-dependent Clp protease protease subunit